MTGNHARARPAVSVQGLAGGVSAAMLIVFCGLTIDLGWVGYIQSDDFSYAEAATQWVRDGYLVGQNHWSLRHLIVLPMAGLFALFGRSEWTLVAPMLAAYFGLLAMTAWGVRRVRGSLASFLSILLIASIPLLAENASTVVSDLPEAVMVFASVWSFFFACERQRRSGAATGLCLGSGAFAGCAFVTRETTLALLAVYGILFLANYGHNRRAYLLIGFGFALVVGIDFLFLFLATGDPLYRMHVTVRGVAGDNPSMVGLYATDGMFDRHGVVIAPRWIQAPLMMLANQAIGPVLWFAIPATIALCLGRLDTPARRAARLLGFVALAWFAILSYALQSLWLVPRYQTVSIVALVICFGLQLADLIAAGRRRLAGSMIGAVLIVNLALQVLGHRDPMFGERALVKATSVLPGTIWTDPGTLKASEWLLDIHGALPRVRAGLPPANAMFAFNSHPRRPPGVDWPLRMPKPDWVPILEIVEPPRPGAKLIKLLGLRSFIPNQIANKLAPPSLSLMVYSTPDSTDYIGK